MNWPPLPDLSSATLVALDTETEDQGLRERLGPGWPFGKSRIVGLSLATPYLSGYYPCEMHPRMGEWLRALFAQPDTLFIFHNASYDLGNLQAQYGPLPLPANLADTGAMAAILDENLPSYSLDNLCVWQGLQGKDEEELKRVAAEHGIKDIKANLWRLPHSAVAQYAEQDARATLALYLALLPRLAEEKLLSAYQLEADLIPMTIEMRRRGIRVDTDAAERAVIHFAQQRDVVLQEISAKLGAPVDMKALRSPQWLVRAFQAESIPYAFTEKGSPSFTASLMKASEHWLPKLIVKAKQMEDFSSKFMANYILKFEHAGRVHPNINLFLADEGGTRSHRVSYSSPPLQQAPARDPVLGPAFRNIFLPDEGGYWCACDFSQQELRILTHYAEVLQLPKSVEIGDQYRNDPNVDFHAMVAELTGLTRKRAKDVNFALIYSAGLKQFAAMTGMSETEAQATIAQYNSKLPFAKILSSKTTRQADKTGIIRLIDGAVCHFPFWESSMFGAPGLPTSREEALRKTRTPGDPWFKTSPRRAYTYRALNRLVQGSAARQTKIAMRDCWRAGLVPLVQMHDELSFSFETEAQGKLAQEIMVNAVKLTVPVKVDMEWGVSWGDSMKAHAFEELAKTQP